MSRLLEGVRVLESASLLNGDRLGALLGDLGADVIKVERPPIGDYIRYFMGQITPGNSPLHVAVNKNKRSVALDLRSEVGLEVFWRLLDTADVFIDGNAGAACTRLGVGYEAQRSRKPDIVYCQYSGFGASGPYSSIPTHGLSVGALAAALPHRMGPSGFMESIPTPDPVGGTAFGGGDPVSAGATHAALYVAAALFQRARTGEGCYIDIASVDGMLAQAWCAVTYALNYDQIVDTSSLRADVLPLSGARYQLYETADGNVLLFACIEAKFWHNFCHAIGRLDLLDSHDGSLVDFGDDDDLRHELQRIFNTEPLAYWMAMATEWDIVMAPAYRTVVETAADPHMRTRGVLHTEDHPDFGPFTYVGEAGVVARQPYAVRYPAPRCGEHTRPVLREIGYSEAELDSLAAKGAIMSSMRDDALGE